MLKFSKTQTKSSQYASREFPEAEFIPYRCHWDKQTIITKGKEMVQVIKLSGFSFETADDEDLDIRKNVRNSLYRSIAAGNYVLWFHTVRRRQPVTVGGKQPEGFAKELNDRWMAKHRSRDTFVNELYISVIYRPDTKGFAALEGLVRKFVQQADTETWEHDIKEAHKELLDITNRIVSTLREYQPKILGVYEKSGQTYCEILEFFSMLLNGAEKKPVQLPSIDLSHYLPTHRLYFGPRAIEVRGPNKSRFATVVGVKEYCASTSAGMMDAFLQLPFEFIIAQSFVFYNRQTAIQGMRTHQKRMLSARDVAVSQINEINTALDLAMSGHISFGNHHLTVMCLAEDLSELEKNTSLAQSELINCGMIPVRETRNLQAAFWAQMPGNFDFIARKSVINSLNLSSFASLHNYPVGRRESNHWGDAVTVLDTSSGTPYFFNFHSRDVGHTTIIGPTGAGKTVLMNFLCAQAQKYNARMFFFDKDRGAEIFIRAIGGNYMPLEVGKHSQFNPLQLPDTSENRSFLNEWLRSMITANEPRVSVEDMEKISEAVNGNYSLRPEDRSLTNIMPFLGLEGPGSVASRMKMWTRRESHGKLFDNDADGIDFRRSRIYGFEMGEILRDKLSLGPVLLYLFHKISMALDGTPTIIVLDEAWALIDNPVFAPKIKDWLKTLRKLNAMVIFATQSVEDASKSAISDTLIQQTATQIFLLNPKATPEYRSTFMLSEREFSLIKGTDPASRFFLVKQSSEVVVARLDLAPVSDLIPILSGRAETVGLLDDIRAEVGDDPNVWLPIFREKVKYM